MVLGKRTFLKTKKKTRKKIFELIAVFMYTICLQNCLNINNIYYVYVQGLFQDFKIVYIYILDQWLKGGKCDISAELMSTGSTRAKFNGHFENHG